MTKKNFVALADTLRLPGEMPAAIHRVFEHYGEQRHIGFEEAVLDAVVTELATFCKSQNSEFNRERWLAFVRKECGPNGGRI